MVVCFEKTGADRKALVAAISEATGEKSEYLGAPGFAYRVGMYTVSKDGTVETGDADAAAAASLLAALEERGFVPVAGDVCLHCAGAVHQDQVRVPAWLVGS